MAIPAKQRWIFYAIALALTLIAVKWAGGQDRADAAPAARQDAAARPASAPAAATERTPELRLDLLGARASPAPAGDPFQARSWAPEPSPAEVTRRRAPPPPPQAPPVPFAYLGKLVEDATTMVFLSQGDRNYVVRAGDTIEGTYRVDRVGDDRLDLTYLPLKTKQTLPFNEASAPPRAAAAAPARSQRRVPDDEDDD